MATQLQIARRLNLDVSTVNKILHRKPGTHFAPDTVRKVFQMAREMGYDFSRVKFRHRREHDRRPADARVHFTLILRTGRRVGRGRARIRDVSPAGARLGGIVLNGARGLPLEPFYFDLRVDGETIRAVPMRLIPAGDDLEIAVRFVDDNGRGQRIVPGLVARLGRK